VLRSPLHPCSIRRVRTIVTANVCKTGCTANGVRRGRSVRWAPDLTRRSPCGIFPTSSNTFQAHWQARTRRRQELWKSLITQLLFLVQSGIRMWPFAWETEFVHKAALDYIVHAVNNSRPYLHLCYRFTDSSIVHIGSQSNR
jgi:hypothetical protein